MSALLTVEQAAPGDVDAVLSIERTLRETAEGARQARTELQSIGGTCRVLPWEGLTAEAFQGVVEELPLDVDTLAQGYERAAGAMLTYAHRLRDLKQRAGLHVAAGTAALAQLVVLRARRAGLQSSLNAAMWAARSAQGSQLLAATDPSPAGAAARAEADRAASAAASHLAQLQRQIAAVDAQLTAEAAKLEVAKQGLYDVRDDARAAGRTAAGLVRDAGDNSFRDRGFAATLGSFLDGAAVVVGGLNAVKKAVTSALMGKEAWKFVEAVLRKADNMGDLMAAFVARESGAVKAVLARLKNARAVRIVGSIGKVLSRAAWPLTIAFGLKDLITGGGYDGLRGTMTKILGGVGAVGGAVLGAVALGGAGVVAAVVGTAAAPFVIAGAAIAVTAYGLWSAGNAIYDNWDTIKGWGQSAGRGVQRAWGGVTSAGRSLRSGLATIGRGFAAPSMLRGLSVF